MLANDSDAQRCNLLAHQTKRMASPAMVVTNHDAQMLPMLRHPAIEVRARARVIASVCTRACARVPAFPPTVTPLFPPPTHTTRTHRHPLDPPPTHTTRTHHTTHTPQDDGRMLFDRILCDVPCCGDGTLRKAPDIWRRWAIGNGNGLHPLQLRITLR